MRWGSRKQHAAAAAPPARCEEEGGGEEQERGSKGKGGRAFSSFSPLSWLAKLAAPKDKEKRPGKHHAPTSTSTPKHGAAAAASAPAFPSCLPKRTSPSPAPATPRRSSPVPAAAAADAAPRRQSVGNDSADAAAARRHWQQQQRRRHCSVGGDRELPPLGRLIPFSIAGSPSQQAAAAAAAPSDTDARARRRRRRRRRSGSGSGRRPSVSGRMPARVLVRSPRRRAAAAELEGLAVVRRTRDPQRAFRESMVEMIASTGGGGAAPPRPEELERLLACYLSLNADEHHDCIVKVFRQVWFEYVGLLRLRPRRC